MADVEGTVRITKPALKAPLPLSFRWAPEFVARIDAARGGVSRSAFVRAAVEAILDAQPAPSIHATPTAKQPAVKRPSKRDTKVKPKPAAVKPSPLEERAVKTCGAGCIVPKGSKITRCITHGMALR